MNGYRLLVVAATAALPALGFAQSSAPSPHPGPSTPVQVMNGPNNPIPVDGLISGDVEIINTEPIKVTVVSPSYPNQTVCTLRVGAAATEASDGFANVSGGSSQADLTCPVGVKGVLVRRAVLALHRGLQPANVQNVIAVFGFSKEESAGLPELAEMNLITGLSFSAPEKVLDAPVPVTPNRAARFDITCAGIPNYPLRCTSGLLLIGDPIPE